MSKKLKDHINRVDTDKIYSNIDINESDISINSSMSINSLDDRLELEKVSEYSNENNDLKVKNEILDKIDLIKKVDTDNNKIRNINIYGDKKIINEIQISLNELVLINNKMKQKD